MPETDNGMFASWHRENLAHISGAKTAYLANPQNSFSHRTKSAMKEGEVNRQKQKCEHLVQSFIRVTLRPIRVSDERHTELMEIERASHELDPRRTPDVHIDVDDTSISMDSEDVCGSNNDISCSIDIAERSTSALVIDAPSPTLTIRAINASENVVTALLDSGEVSVVSPITIDRRDYKSILQHSLTGTPEMPVWDLILLQGGDDKVLTLEDKSIIANAFFAGFLIVVLAPHDLAIQVTGYTNALVPALTRKKELLHYIHKCLPSVVRLSQLLTQNLAGKLGRFASVNKWKIFLTRAPLSLVPFGVAAANIWETGKILKQAVKHSGMVPLGEDDSVKKEAEKNGNSVLVNGQVMDTFGDLYSYAMALCIADEATALVADTLLGSSVIFVSAGLAVASACHSRPRMVNSVARLMGTLQRIYIMFPRMRYIDADVEIVDLN